jgi:hypothetical protein
MKDFINYHIFTQTTLDSGALTQLGAVVHKFPDPGHYVGSIIHRDQSIGRFYLSVDPDCSATQVNIDLATIGEDRVTEEWSNHLPENRFVVGSDGYGVFHVSRGAGGFAATVTQSGGNPSESGKQFDTRELKRGDVFAVTLIRPGTYRVVNLGTTVRGEIVVAYPQVRNELYRPGEPVAVRCHDNSFEPSLIKIAAAQGQVYHIATTNQTRIRIELVRADDGPLQANESGPRSDRKQKRRTGV